MQVLNASFSISFHAAEQPRFGPVHALIKGQSMSITLGVVMDPISQITPYKDSTLAMLLEAQRRGWTIYYMEMADLCVREGVAYGQTRTLSLRDDNNDWFEFTSERSEMALGELDVILMRKDPPFDTEYIYATYILERAEAAGALVVNKPSALRDVNEKMAITAFSQFCAPTLVSRSAAQIRRFLLAHDEIVLKPLDGMGGSRIFRVAKGDPNLSVMLEVLTEHGTRYAMAQKFLPAIEHGDKRILVIDGEPVPKVLARIPAAGESRGNLAAGGRGEGMEITQAERDMCTEMASFMREKGLIFVGIDVIGDKLTEINVTSPTCIRELDKIYDINISELLLDAIAKRLQA